MVKAAPIFPEQLKQRLQTMRRIGIVGVLVGLAFMVSFACFSFTPSDPSFNNASSASAQNWLGRPGAFLADALLQSFGLASWLLPLVLLAWGWRLYKQDRDTRFIWRGVWLLPTLVGLTIAAAALPVTMRHDLHPGGSVGLLLMNFFSSLLQGWFSSYAGYVAGGIAAFTALLCGVPAFGLSPSEWGGLGGRAVRSLRFGWALFLYGLKWLVYLTWKAASWRPSKVSGQESINTKTLEKPSRRLPKRKKANKVDVKSRQEVKAGGRASEEQQVKMPFLQDADFELPSLDLLQAPSHRARNPHLSQSALQKNAEMLQSVLNDFGVNGEIVAIHPGPVVTLYELEPAPGLKSSRVINLAEDIARSMSAISVRVAVVPGRNVIGIELPNKKREMVYLREVLASEVFETTKFALPLVLGKDIGGAPIIVDLSRMPHLLVAGTTGSGKSVGINCMLLSLLYRLPPEKCRMILIDPKMLELSVYDDIPHLLTPVVTDPKKAIVSLKWAVHEMEQRYRAMSKLGVRNIEGYNARLRKARQTGEVLSRRVQTGFDPDSGKPVFEDQPIDLTELPYIVIVVDEFADLMLVAGKEVEAAIQRLAQMARAAGIHMIMATQRPSVDVVTGTVKANFPTRISFQVTSKIDSRTILGEGGAENLLGKGDMLHMAGGGRITRVHGPFVDDSEVEAVSAHLRSQGEPAYIDQVTDESDPALAGGIADIIGGGNGQSEEDQLYDQAVAIVVQERKASTSFVQRHLRIGYNRAARIIERMEDEGVISAANHVGRREVLVGQ